MIKIWYAMFVCIYNFVCVVSKFDGMFVCFCICNIFYVWMFVHFNVCYVCVFIMCIYYLLDFKLKVSNNALI